VDRHHHHIRSATRGRGESHEALSFAHLGFEKADEVYALTTTGWGYYLVSLQQ
jgi:hypothetical protein